MKAYVVSAPDTSSSYTSVYMEYRIGNGFHLYRTERSLAIRSGIMGIDCTRCDDEGKLAPLIGEITKECTLHNFSGVILEISQNPSSLFCNLTQELDRSLTQDGKLLFVRENVAKFTEHAKILVGTALSGGTFSRHLQEHVSSFGSERIALDVERMRMDFTLPARNGAGVPLSDHEFDELHRRYRTTSFFSNDLCTYYFTYRKNGKSHFVLYDNAYSIKRKIAAARKFGIDRFFFYYPEVSGILDNIL